eukprot:1196124-Prorocentrum_minimum.AAC.7
MKCKDILTTDQSDAGSAVTSRWSSSLGRRANGPPGTTPHRRRGQGSSRVAEPPAEERGGTGEYRSPWSPCPTRESPCPTRESPCPTRESPCPTRALSPPERALAPPKPLPHQSPCPTRALAPPERALAPPEPLPHQSPCLPVARHQSPLHLPPPLERPGLGQPPCDTPCVLLSGSHTPALGAHRVAWPRGGSTGGTAWGI